MGSGKEKGSGDVIGVQRRSNLHHLKLEIAALRGVYPERTTKIWKIFGGLGFRFDRLYPHHRIHIQPMNSGFLMSGKR
jgi:hypothetical protein